MLKQYDGKDTNNVDTFLKKKYVDILNDYKNIIIKKYNINEEEILSKLKDMNDLNEDNIKQQINDFIDSLNEQEQLYYDLFFQSIIEAPNLSSKINSWLSPIIKILRDTIGTFIGIKIISFTGSKLLTGLTASVGTSIFIKDITDIVLKKRYFSENEEFRKIYHINQRNSYDKRWNVMKRKIINTAKKVFNPIKKNFVHF